MFHDTHAMTSKNKCGLTDVKQYYAKQKRLSYKIIMTLVWTSLSLTRRRNTKLENTTLSTIRYDTK